MIRVICCENEHTAAIHVGGPAEISYRSFEVEAPALEAWLDEHKVKDSRGHSYNVRTIIGIERLPAPRDAGQKG